MTWAQWKALTDSGVSRSAAADFLRRNKRKSIHAMAEEFQTSILMSMQLQRLRLQQCMAYALIKHQAAAPHSP